MKRPQCLWACAIALCLFAPAHMFAASHREAPITALDRTADITDPARAAGPEGALAADVSPGSVRRRSIGRAQEQADEDTDDAWRRAGGSASRGRNKKR